METCSSRDVCLEHSGIIEHLRHMDETLDEIKTGQSDLGKQIASLQVLFQPPTPEPKSKSTFFFKHIMPYIVAAIAGLSGGVSVRGCNVDFDKVANAKTVPTAQQVDE